MSRLTTLASLLLLAAPLAAQSNAERMANDQYSRSHDYDLIHQKIEVGNFNWDSLSLTGRVTTTLRALRPAFDSVVLDAGDLLTITRVSARPKTPAGKGAELRFSRMRDTLVVYLPKAANFGDTLSFVIDYQGTVRNGKGLTFIEADSLPPRRPRQIWSQGEDHDNHYWFPTYDFPNDKATWELVATVPKGFTAVSNGKLVLDRTAPNGTRTMDWLQDQPTATYLASLIVAPLVKISDRWKTTPVDYYVYKGDSAAARRLFAETPDMIDVFSRLTGVPYPWRKYAQTTVADFFGGMENVSATTLVDWIPDSRAYADRPWYHYILIPHELAHQWFGDYTTLANWANMWLNEGFAEFMPGQYWKTKLGRHAEDDYYLDEYDQFLNIDQNRRMPLAALNSNNVYPRGALVLRMLKAYLGEERFWAGVRRYLKDHPFGNAITDDLRQAFLAATGENLDWFWEQWIYAAGYPEFAVEATWDSAAASLRLQVKQVQQDTATADSSGLRYVTPQVFRMPVTVRVGMGASEAKVTTWLSAREQEITVPGVTSAPTMVIFDDGNTILKQLTFQQPTAWLANQLARDPDLWNRNWVIEQLRGRKDDAEAVAALGRAATGSDYFLTRVQAAQALGGMTGDVARQALLTASRDTSAQVRAAAVASLGPDGGEAGKARAQELWARDTSYAVQGAALGALVRLDPANAHALLQRGLTTPSYQDAILDAALGAIIRTNDTTMIEAVDGAVARSGNAAFVLGILGARGATRALDLLGAHVTSPRAAVRKRALQAFQFVVPPQVGKERLGAIAASATPAIRQEIEATLGRIGER
ncbi:MAG: M1 family aminopeptidase [Gemmatimonadales bacterium]